MLQAYAVLSCMLEDVDRAAGSELHTLVVPADLVLDLKRAYDLLELELEESKRLGKIAQKKVKRWRREAKRAKRTIADLREVLTAWGEPPFASEEPGE